MGDLVHISGIAQTVLGKLEKGEPMDDPHAVKRAQTILNATLLDAPPDSPLCPYEKAVVRRQMEIILRHQEK